MEGRKNGFWIVSWIDLKGCEGGREREREAVEWRRVRLLSRNVSKERIE